jgi:hypothetical protein
MTDLPIEELGKSLRRAYDAWANKGYTQGSGMLFKHAADMIDSLAAQLREAEDGRQYWIAQAKNQVMRVDVAVAALAEAQSTIATLGKALEPIAEYAHHAGVMDVDWSGDGNWIGECFPGGIRRRITYGNLRAAKAAYDASRSARQPETGGKG